MIKTWLFKRYFSFKRLLRKFFGLNSRISDREKGCIIAEALETDGGRMALASAMVAGAADELGSSLDGLERERKLDSREDEWQNLIK